MPVVPGVSSWAYWPVSDRYSLIPKWEEWYSISGVAYEREEEDHRYSLVGRIDAPDVFFVVSVKDNTDPDNPVVPVGTPVFRSSITLREGFTDSRTLLVDTVVDDVTSEWTGDVKIAVPLVVRQWMGAGRVADFVVDMWMVASPNSITRIAFGDMVMR